jgi:hypothetical protein
VDQLQQLDYLLNNIQDLEASIYLQEINLLQSGAKFKFNLHQLDKYGFNSNYLSHYRGVFELIGNVYFKEKPPFLDRFLRDSVTCFKPKFFSDDLFSIQIISKNYILREKICSPHDLQDLDFTLSELTYFLLNPEIEIHLKLLIKGPTRLDQESKEEIFNSSKYLNNLLDKSKSEKKTLAHSLLYPCSKDYFPLFVEGDYINNAQHLNIYNVIQLRYIWSLVWSGCFNSPSDLLNKSKEDANLIEDCCFKYLDYLKLANKDSFKSSYIDKWCFIWHNLKKQIEKLF